MTNTKTKVSKTYSKSKNVGRARLALLAVLISQAVTTWVEAGPMASGKANITEYPAPVTRGMPLHVGVDANSNVWFGEFHAGKLVRFSNGTMKTYNIDPTSGPMNLWVNRADGSVWFSALGNYIVHLTASGQLTTYPIPSPNSMPMGVTGDSQGNIWFSEQFNGKIGVIRPSGHIDEFDIPTPLSMPTGLTVDQYDNVWFAESGMGKIGVLRKTGGFNEYNLPMGGHPMGINYCPTQKTQGVVWFTETIGNSIGSITQDGKITQYRLPTPLSTPMMVMEDMVGNVWATEMDKNQIARLRANRTTITEYAIPTRLSAPMGLGVDPNNGSVWFGETRGNNLGQLIPLD
ncbi:MAG: Vgb family protein [Gammaproteobacteria bacterium]